MNDFLTAEGAEGAEVEKRGFSTDLVRSNVRLIAYTGISGCQLFKDERGLNSLLKTNYDYFTGLDKLVHLTKNKILMAEKIAVQAFLLPSFFFLPSFFLPSSFFLLPSSFY
ncbi:hypothetical protein IQ270_12295 [Microcoleus sp. LEGE 07076]|uniref:hypothetical protein n=1 Tax=Microcoleus sp. LEGE 07076 TaxID=915322 RepID=UPI0018800EA4|nr:hypothetical protein [Microcoleus sp. LEGE 07076]MBE9185462.1 hypothetical protein [Microcoleus sp. LEGE 07076]